MSLIAAPFAILAILYAGGFLAQLLGNYATWKQGGGIPGDGTSPLAASPDFLLCLSSVLRPPYGVYGILICIGLLAVLLIMVMRMGYGDAGEYDEDRNFSYSAKGTYGTSGWMSRKEIMFASSGAGQNLVSQIHAVAQNQSMNILMAKLWGQALLADYAPNQCLDPHFRFVAPLHQGAAAVVGHEDAGGRKEYSSGAGTADLRGVDPHFFHFSGTEKSRIDNPAASVTIRRKNCRFFIPIHTYTRIIHGHIGFCQAV